MLLLWSLAVNFILTMLLDLELGFFVLVELLQNNFGLFDFIILEFKRTDYSNFTQPDLNRF